MENDMKRGIKILTWIPLKEGMKHTPSVSFTALAMSEDSEGSFNNPEKINDCNC